MRRRVLRVLIRVGWDPMRKFPPFVTVEGRWLS